VTFGPLAKIRDPRALAFRGTQLLMGERDGFQGVGHRVRSVTFTANGVAGKIGAFVVPAPPGVGLQAPRGLAFDHDGNVYLAEDGVTGRTRKITTTGTLAWTKTFTAKPRGLAVGLDAEGLARGPLFVVVGDDVRKFNLVSGVDEGSIFADGSATGLSTPNGLAVLDSNTILIADAGNHQVKKVDLTTRAVTIVGGTTPGTAGDGGPAEAAQLASPQAVCVDAAGNIYIAEQEGHRVRRLNVAVDVDVSCDPTDPDLAEARLSFPSGRTPGGVNVASLRLRVYGATPGAAIAPVGTDIVGDELLVKFNRADIETRLPATLRIEGRFQGAPIGRFFSGDLYLEKLDATPPTVAIVSCNPDCLWPPNHEMTTVDLTFRADDNCSPVALSGLSVSLRSNEPDNGSGSGNTTGDTNGADGFSGDVPATSLTTNGDGSFTASFSVRSERAGALPGPRIYTATIVAKDSARPQNTSAAVSTHIVIVDDQNHECQTPGCSGYVP
jgi:hypothetical protein